MKQNSKTTLKDLYLQYDHKWYDINSSTVPVPYFPKTEISEHQYKLTYKEWKKVILCYFKYLMLHLLSGKAFKIPNFLGTLQLMKWKPARRKINIRETVKRYGEYNKTVPKEERKYVYHNNHHTNGYSPITKWYRNKEKFPFKWHWRFELSRDNWRMISKELINDSSMINRLIEY